jgi:hypothetical protein
MFEETVNRPSRWRVFWPDVRDAAGAREAMNVGSWLVLAYAALTTLGAVVSAVGTMGAGQSVSLWATAATGAVSAGAVAGIGLGIRRGLRSIAALGLAFLGLGLIGLLATGSIPGPFDVAALVGMVNGVRGTFAAQRLRAAATNHSADAAS